MLTQLHIRQFAIVDELSIDFRHGMTAITGETGAGKSIALDALSLCLGARAESGMVRNGSDKAEITACFQIQALAAVQKWLDEHELAVADDEECILRRIITSEGRSKGFINGAPVPMNLLKELGGLLVSIHGQHDHHLLMKPDYQMQLLDQYAGHRQLLNTCAELFREWRQLKREKQRLQSQQDAQEARKQLLDYQVNELQEAALSADAYAELESEHKRLANASELLADSQYAVNTLYDGEHNNVYNLVQATIERLTNSAELDPQLQPMVALLNEASVQIEEAARELRHYQDHVELDPELLNECEKRMSAAMQLARKHQVAPEQLGELLNSLQAELNELNAAETRLADLDPAIADAEKAYVKVANELTTSRQHAAEQLAVKVTDTMHKLNIPDGEFQVNIQSSAQEFASALGIDQITFTVSANAGQPLQPIAKVASGGELSRISLAIQVLTASTNAKNQASSRATGMPTLIFDEVDVGVSGPTATTVGKLLQALGEQNQVICVTHLPQVAARAHQHLFVSKESRNGQTVTFMQSLDQNDRVHALARLLAGDAVTDHSLANARELLAS
ncbi:DNA repair protein RecN [Aliidiomarina haloalkalitolerans]|uniref:DNA repair protein RecN n=1 Tax=Aliidiomarina haloalkalitolerans TaxID=859059 RepID=A0A432VZC1_9GAMM|nr:DNA repair protein RecN [Aliidiomarina haloalkalitolerans]RUO22034.1 DNA repair protein RecN [Aliidiomarina haloalkalitolerans]